MNTGDPDRKLNRFVMAYALMITEVALWLQLFPIRFLPSKSFANIFILRGTRVPDFFVKRKA